MPCKLALKIRVLSAFALVIAVLTVLIAFAAQAQRAGTGKPSAKLSAESMPVQATTPARALQHQLLLTARELGRDPAIPSQRNKLGTVSMGSNLSLFLPAVTYHSGGYDMSLAVADVNADRKPDLLVADYDGGVDVLLGNGDGTFQPAVFYSAGSVWSIAVADVNGDGKPDLVLAIFYSNAVAVLLGNGDGTFQSAVTYGSSTSGAACPDSVALADVNGDRKPDIVVINWCGQSYLTKQASVLIGNGDGTFQSAVGYSTGGEIPWSVAVADVNRDGKSDLLVANGWASFQDTNHGSVGVLLGNGDGTFQPTVAYITGDAGAHSVAVADVNGDGKPDLIAAGGRVAVLAGEGDGTFLPAVTFNSGISGGSSVAVADVNGDSKPDVIVASCANNTCNAVGVLLGNGDGTLQPGVTYGSGGYGAGWATLADINGDTNPDILVATCDTWSCSSGAVGVLLNNHATPTSLASSLNPSIYGQAVTWTATVAPSGAISPTGTVSFTWGSAYRRYTIGTATLNSSGVATLTRSNLNAYLYPLTAVYRGDANNPGSTSAVLNQIITQTTSAATITSSPNPSASGQPITFTATITSPTVLPTGPVTFAVGKTVLGTAQLSGGKAKFTTSTLAVGATKVTATYYGNSNIAKSSASVTQTVHQ